MIQTAPAAHASTNINATINFQGRLLSNAGAVVADGSYNMEFKIYAGGTGSSAGDGGVATQTWTEDWVYGPGSGTGWVDNRVTVKNGYFSVNLGSICPLTATTCNANSGNSQTNSVINFDQSTLWLSMNVSTSTGTLATFSGGDGEMLPMKRLSSAVYALQAANSEMLGGLTSSQFIQNTTTQQTGNINLLTSGTSATGVQLQAAASGSGPVLVLQDNTSSTGDLLEAKNTAGTTILASINASGNLFVASGIDTQSGTGLTIGGLYATSISLGNTGTTAQTISVATNTAANTVNIATGANTSGTQTINIGTGATSSGKDTIAIGSANGSSTTTIEGGTSGTLGSPSIAIGNGLTNHYIEIGSNGLSTNFVYLGSLNGTSGTAIQGGTGNISINTGAGSATTGAVSITTGNASAGTAGNITIDTGTSVPSGTQLSNYTFESGTNNMGGWYGVTSATQSTAQAHGGTHSLAVTESGASWAVSNNYQTGPLITAGHEYAFTAWVRAATVAESIYGDVCWDGSSAGCAAWNTGVTDTTSGWVELTGNATAPSYVSGSVYADLVFGDTAGANGQVQYLDDVTITDLGNISAPAILVGAANAQAVTIGNLSQGGYTNLYGGGNGIQIQAANNGLINIGTAYQDNVAIGNTTYGTDTIQAKGIAETISGSSNTGTGYPSDVIQTSTNSPTAFQVLNSVGNAILNVDTAASQVQFGQSSNIGYTQAGSSVDVGYHSTFTAQPIFSGPAGGALTSASVYVGAAIQASPNNRYQVALYANSTSCAGSATSPCLGSWLASSASGTLSGTGWNTIALSYTLTANTEYWLVYDTNTTNTSNNALNFNPNVLSQFSPAEWGALTYGSGANGGFPSTLATTGYSATEAYSMYATVTGGGPGMTIGANGVVSTPAVFQNATNSNSAFQIQNALGLELMNVDTANSAINFGASTSVFKPQANSGQALGVQNAAGFNVLTADTSSNSAQGQVILGASSHNNGVLQFDNSAGTTQVGLAVTSANTNTYLLDLPIVAPSISQCLEAGATTATQLVFSSCLTGALVQAPTSNAAGVTGANVVSPTASGITGLTVNGTTNATGATALVVAQSNANDGSFIDLTNTTGTQNNGLLIKRDATGGTTTAGLNITNAAGTLTTGLALSGTIGTDISRGSGTLSVQGAGGIALQPSSTAAVNIGAGATGASRLAVAWESGDTSPTLNVGSTSSSDNMTAIVGTTYSTVAITGTSTTSDGVDGYSTSGSGVYGYSSSGDGLNGHSATGVGVFGYSAGAGTAIQGGSTTGISGYFQGGNANSQPTLEVQANGAATGNLLQVENSAGTAAYLAVSSAGNLTVQTNTSSQATLIQNAGSGIALLAQNTGTSGTAGVFNNTSTSNTSPALAAVASYGQAATTNTFTVQSNNSGSYTNMFTIGADGAVLSKPLATFDSVSDFQIQPSGSATPVLDVDTSNTRIGINTATPHGTLEVAGPLTILGQGEGGTPTATTIRGAAGAGTDVAGADLIMSASDGTGGGGSGNLVFKTASTTGSAMTITKDASASATATTGTSISWNHTTGSQNNKVLVVGVNATTPAASTVTQDTSAFNKVGGFGGGNVSWTQTVANNANRVMFVALSGDSASVTVNSVMDGGCSGTPMTLVSSKTGTGGTGGATVFVYELINPPTGTNTLCFNAPGGGGDWVYGSVDYYNVNQTTPIGSVVSAGGNALTDSESITTTSTNQMAFAAFADSGNFQPSCTATVSSGTFIWGDCTFGGGGAAQKQGVNGTSTISWTYSGNTGGNGAWASLGFPINPAVSNTVTSVTYGGTALTRLGGTTCPAGGSSACNTDLWYLKNPASGTASIVANVSSSATLSAGSVTYYNVDQTSPVGSVVTNSGTGTTASVVDASTATQLVIATAGNSSGNTMTNGGSQTGQWADGTGASYNIGASMTGGASATPTWTLTSAPWTAVAVPLNPSAGGSSTADTLTERLRITSSGYVGIGTSSPTASLDVAGNALVQAATNSTSTFQIQDASANTILNLDTAGDNLTVSGNVYIANNPSGATSLLVVDSSSSSSDPTEVDGAMYYSSSKATFRCGANGVWVSCLSGLRYSNTDQAALPTGNTVANSNVAATFADTYTIPAGDCVKGRVYRVTMSGTMADTSTSPSLLMQIKLGSTIIATNVASAVSMSATTFTWTANLNITCAAAVSSSSLIEADGQFTSSANGGAWFFSPLANQAASVNTSTSEVLSTSVKWGNTTNETITLRQMTVESLGP